MFTLILEFAAKASMLILVMIIFSNAVKAQTAAGDVFTTITYLPTTFGWVAPYWAKVTDTANMLSGYMRVQRAEDSINSIKSSLALKIGLTALSLTTVGTSGAATYNNSTGVFNVPQYSGYTVTAPTAISSGARSFNTAYQVSSTLASHISVTPQITCALSLLAGQAGNITLEISPNGSTGWIYIGQVSGSNTGALTVGLATNQVTGAQLEADLPIGYYWRLTTANTTGTPTYAFLGGSFRTY